MNFLPHFCDHVQGDSLFCFFGFAVCAAGKIYAAGLQRNPHCLAFGNASRQFAETPRSIGIGDQLYQFQNVGTIHFVPCGGHQLHRYRGIGRSTFVGVAVVVFAVLFLSFFLSKRFNCPGNTGILVGFGTAICGSSAIAALAPSLQKQNKEDVAIAMAVVNLLGTLGMLFLPWALLQINWPSSDVASSAIGYLVGGSLHSVGNVAGAGFAIGKSAGDVAITVKLARVALLTPGLIFMTYLTQRNAEGSWKRYFKLPWYLIGFIIVTFVVSVVDVPKPALKDMEYVGKVILTIAMAAIGLKVSFKKLLQAGSRGLRFGVVMFALQLSLLGLAILVMR